MTPAGGTVERLARAACLDPVVEAHLTTYGYAVVPFLDTDGVAAVEEAYWRFGPAPGDPQMCTHFDFQSNSPQYKERISQELRPMLEPRIDEVLDRYHLVSPNFVMKWPGARSGFAPHQDTNIVDENRHRSFTIWCPLTDVTGEDGVDNGVLHFVPGSHEFVRWIRAHDPGAFAFSGLEQAIIDRYGVPVPVRAGEAIIFDHRAAHFSMPNDATAPRLVIAMGLRPDEADLLHYRRADGDRFDVYGIDDEYYIKLDPFLLRDGVPGYQKVDEVRLERPRVAADEFDRWCRAVAPVTDAPAPIAGRRVTADDPFCFRCGTTEDLAGGNVRPDDHGNLQMLCRSCLAGVRTSPSRSRAAAAATAPRSTVRTSPPAPRPGAAGIAVSFHDPALEHSIAVDGFAVVDVPTDLVDELEAIYRRTRPEGMTEFTATIQLDDVDVRREVHQGVRAAVTPFVSELLTGHRIVVGNYVVKQPGPWVVEPHQDFNFVDDTAYRAVLAWIPLHDVDATSSCLHVVPGSHRLPTHPRGSGDHRFPFAPALEHLKANRSVEVALRRGQAVLYDPRLLHWSTGNAASVERVAAAFAAVPVGADLLHYHVNREGSVTITEIDDDVYADTPFHTPPVRGTVRETVPLTGLADYDARRACEALDALDPPIETRTPEGRSSGRWCRPLTSEPTFVDPTLEQGYRDDGFVVMPFLAPDEVEELAAFYASIAHEDDHGLTVDYLRPDRRNMERIAEALAPVWERHFPGVFRDHRAVFATFVTKHPGRTSDMYLHEDRSWVDERRHRSGTLWIPLTDTGPGLDNGGLEIVPHSDRLAVGWSGTDTADPARAHEARLREALVPVAVGAGQAVYYDSRTLHASPPNRSDRPRVAIACAVAPADAPLIHVVGDGRRSHVYAVNEQFFIRFGPREVADVIADNYTLLETVPDDAELTAERIDEVVGGSPAQAEAAEISPEPHFWPLPPRRKMLDEYEIRLAGSRHGRWYAPLMGRVVEMNNRRLRAVYGVQPNPRPTVGVPWADRLRSWHPKIRAEWDAFVAAGHRLPELEDIFGAPQGLQWSWWQGTPLFIRGKPCPGMGVAFRDTCAALAEVPGLHSSMLSVIGPGGLLPLHTGPNGGAVRLLVGVSCGDDAILTVGDREYPLRDGEHIFFDDTEIHGSMNRGSSPRVMLLCDVIQPVRGPVAWRNRIVQELHHELVPRFRHAPAVGAEWMQALNPEWPPTVHPVDGAPGDPG